MYDVEKRKQRRYSLHVPIKVECYKPEALSATECTTRDISSRGVFIDTKGVNLHPGDKVHLEVFLTIDKLKELFGLTEIVTLKIDGSILRSMSNGMAIEFDKKYSIFPVTPRTD